MTDLYDAPTNSYDALPRKFTGKERDPESNLDYFPARYYSNTMGRWLSPDWSATPEPVPYAEFSDPQSINLYSYVRAGWPNWWPTLIPVSMFSFPGCWGLGFGRRYKHRASRLVPRRQHSDTISPAYAQPTPAHLWAARSSFHHLQLLSPAAAHENATRARRVSSRVRAGSTQIQV